ncbi:MAG: HAMP domain-containing histidine kinase [Phycisphaeraceae bacterium]|nr:HAMP domain-containing histidine kinase [Phycisphaerales bacterium]MCB9859296.1 HAMP domain-containing histidine kinase [Phycisphaeraceae bacterium]
MSTIGRINLSKIRDARAWLVFALCALASAAALAWVSVRALQLETGEKQARANATFQEKVRLALWRMDSTVAPILAVEASRPYFHYRSFYPADRAVTRLLEDITPGEILVPSPLLEGAGEYIRLHFQIEADGTVTSPQAPSGNLLDLAEGQHVAPAQVETAIQRLDKLTVLVRGAEPTTDGMHMLGFEEREKQSESFEDPFGAVPSSASLTPKNEQSIPPGFVPERQAQTRALQPPTEPATTDDASNARRRYAYKDEDASLREKLINDAQTRNSPNDRSDSESARDQAVFLTQSPSPALDESTLGVDMNQTGLTAKAIGSPYDKLPVTMLAQTDITQEPFVAQWRSGLPGSPELLFTRRIMFANQTLTQGFWIDWPALEKELLQSARSLLPDATLVPIYEASQREAFRNQGRLLATVPVVFEPGTPAPVSASMFSPTRLGLLVAWLSLIAAAVGIGVVLRKSMELAERRGRFVSAVTHELRTPLTSFCLYTDLLAHDMVKDEEAKTRSLDTLHREAQRLAGIVENVLAYARLGKQKRTRSLSRTPVIPTIQRMMPTLNDAAERADMQLMLDIPEALEGTSVTADETTVERICANLVDNACKYGKPDRDDIEPAIEISVQHAERNMVEICVRDFGPGVPAHEHTRIFKPFEQVERDGKAEGLGLGLALSRQLAQQFGGDLIYRDADGGGALFILRLVRAAS